MKKNINGFSLIEVIVATSILTIAVFGIFKLIGENSKILANSHNYIQANLLLQPAKECLDYLLKKNGLNTMKSEVIPFYLNLSGFSGPCLIGNNATRNNLDNIEYSLYVEKNNEGIDFIDWKINISSDFINPLYFDYLQK